MQHEPASVAGRAKCAVAERANEYELAMRKPATTGSACEYALFYDVPIFSFNLYISISYFCFLIYLGSLRLNSSIPTIASRGNTLSSNSPKSSL